MFSTTHTWVILPVVGKGLCKCSPHTDHLKPRARSSRPRLWKVIPLHAEAGWVLTQGWLETLGLLMLAEPGVLVPVFSAPAAGLWA